MVRVTLELSSLLADVVGVREVVIDAGSPAEALLAAADQVPALRTHVFDSKGAMRPHVLCFQNDVALRGASLEGPLAEGDTLRIHQAVSGG